MGRHGTASRRDPRRAIAAYTAGTAAVVLAAALVAGSDGVRGAVVATAASAVDDGARPTSRPGHRQTWDRDHAAKRSGHGPIGTGPRTGPSDSTFKLGPFTIPGLPDWP